MLSCFLLVSLDSQHVHIFLYATPLHMHVHRLCSPTLRFLASRFHISQNKYKTVVLDLCTILILIQQHAIITDNIQARTYSKSSGSDTRWRETRHTGQEQHTGALTTPNRRLSQGRMGASQAWAFSKLSAKSADKVESWFKFRIVIKAFGSNKTQQSHPSSSL